MLNETSRQFDLIAFDWDGTLFDSTAIITRCIQLAVRDVGGTVPSDVRAARYPELAARYRHHYLGRQHDIVLFEGVQELLELLRSRHHLLAVATGKSRRGLNDALRIARLEALFDGSRTADETAGKPDPLMLRELMAEFDVPPERTLMIGDTTHDLLMAKNAGCASLGVSYGAHDSGDFAEFAPRHVAHSVAELRDWLLSNG